MLSDPKKKGPPGQRPLPLGNVAAFACDLIGQCLLVLSAKFTRAATVLAIALI